MGKLLISFIFLVVLYTVSALILPQDDTDDSQSTENLSFNSNEAEDPVTPEEMTELARSFWTEFIRPAIVQGGLKGALTYLGSH